MKQLSKDTGKWTEDKPRGEFMLNWSKEHRELPTQIPLSTAFILS